MVGHWIMAKVWTAVRVIGFAVLIALGGPSASPPAAAAASSSHLTVTVTWAPGVVDVWTLTCDPVGGTHPGRVRACALLEGLRRPFAAPPEDVACTMIYSGPETAQVVGRWHGHKVHRTFSRTNGCETALWHRYRALFSAPGVVTIRGRVDLGPTCPVERPGQSCTTIGAAANVTATSAGRTRTARSGVDGFALRLPRAVWRITADVGMSCATIRVDARTGATLTPVVISCYTGIRARSQMS